MHDGGMLGDDIMVSRVGSAEEEEPKKPLFPKSHFSAGSKPEHSAHTLRAPPPPFHGHYFKSNQRRTRSDTSANKAVKGGVCTRHRSKGGIVANSTPTLQPNADTPPIPSCQSLHYEDEDGLDS